MSVKIDVDELELVVGKSSETVPHLQVVHNRLRRCKDDLVCFPELHPLLAGDIPAHLASDLLRNSRHLEAALNLLLHQGLSGSDEDADACGEPTVEVVYDRRSDHGLAQPRGQRDNRVVEQSRAGHFILVAPHFVVGRVLPGIDGLGVVGDWARNVLLLLGEREGVPARSVLCLRNGWRRACVRVYVGIGV